MEIQSIIIKNKKKMAIFFKDEILEPKKDGSELEKIYHDGLKRIEELFAKHKGTVILRRLAPEVFDTTGNSKKPTPPFALPTQIPMYVKGVGSISIRYSKNPPTRNDRSVTYPSSRRFISDMLVLSDKEMDLAWFIIEASDYVASSKDEMKGNKFMYIEDVVKDIEKRGEDLRRFVKLDYMLLDEDSPVYNKTDIVWLADKFGVDVNESSLFASACLLRDSVVASDNKKDPDFNVDSFMKAVHKRIASKKKDDEVPEPPYTYESLAELSQPVLNAVSTKMHTKKPPHVTRGKQTDLIMEAQKVSTE